MTYYKVLTHDFRSPFYPEEPLCDGETFPVELPSVKLDTSDDECGAGWNCVTDLAGGFRIAGLWRTGRPAQVVLVQPSADVITRGDKVRSSGLTLLRMATAAEIVDGIKVFS